MTEIPHVHYLSGTPTVKGARGVGRICYVCHHEFPETPECWSGPDADMPLCEKCRKEPDEPAYHETKPPWEKR